jgi:peptidoglycan hydrolase-like protein with peptidoglycan-binding domain
VSAEVVGAPPTRGRVCPRRAWALAALWTGTLGLLAVPALAGAQAVVAPTPTPPPASTPAVGSGTSAPAPAPGRMVLAVQGAGTRPRFALLGRRIVVHGALVPYVAGQTVKVSFYLDGRKVAVRLPAVVAGANDTGHFEVDFTSHQGGVVWARAAHYASVAQVAFSARSPSVRFVNPNVRPGDRGQSVRLLQAALYALHYAVPLTGVFDEGTGQALIAYRKMTGLERIPAAGTRVFELLAHHAGGFHVRYPGDGRHVEADLTTQVLAEIEAGGHVRRIYTMSSGKPSTPTVVGRFRVYEKTPGENSEGMVDSNYFIRGYAIHGYAEVPTYAASHGCLRVPIPDAGAIYSWVQVGTPVDVYDADGAGSTRVSPDAGP